MIYTSFLELNPFNIQHSYILEGFSLCSKYFSIRIRADKLTTKVFGDNP